MSLSLHPKSWGMFKVCQRLPKGPLFCLILVQSMSVCFVYVRVFTQNNFKCHMRKVYTREPQDNVATCCKILQHVLVMDKFAFFVEKFVLTNVQSHQNVFPSLTHLCVCVRMSDLQSVCSILLTGLQSCRLHF